MNNTKDKNIEVVSKEAYLYWKERNQIDGNTIYVIDPEDISTSIDLIGYDLGIQKDEAKFYNIPIKLKDILKTFISDKYTFNFEPYRNSKYPIPFTQKFYFDLFNANGKVSIIDQNQNFVKTEMAGRKWLLTLSEDTFNTRKESGVMLVFQDILHTNSIDIQMVKYSEIANNIINNIINNNGMASKISQSNIPYYYTYSNNLFILDSDDNVYLSEDIKLNSTIRSIFINKSANKYLNTTTSEWEPLTEDLIKKINDKYLIIIDFNKYASQYIKTVMSEDLKSKINALTVNDIYKYIDNNDEDSKGDALKSKKVIDYSNAHPQNGGAGTYSFFHYDLNNIIAFKGPYEALYLLYNTADMDSEPEIYSKIIITSDDIAPQANIVAKIISAGGIVLTKDLDKCYVVNTTNSIEKVDIPSDIDLSKLKEALA